MDLVHCHLSPNGWGDLMTSPQRQHPQTHTVDLEIHTALQRQGSAKAGGFTHLWALTFFDANLHASNDPPRGATNHPTHASNRGTLGRAEHAIIPKVPHTPTS
mmetsp:Transcript_140656/g.244965  ORF Transcript_140656/g.244965 Transcript_140656/m.244965 type:complete len:103 (-) Transcript_140656:311-619(-)